MKALKHYSSTLILIGTGLVAVPGATLAEEKATPLATTLSATTLSGYVDTSAQWNLGTGNAHVPTYAFGGSAKADGFNLNVVRLALERPVDAADAWGAGYKVDLLFGPDANLLPTQSTGVGADFGVRQAYLALHAPVGNGLDFKVGVWDTIIGYEVFDSINDPNFTRSYGYTIEPTTHTGVQASYALLPSLAATVGIADTFGSTINQRAFPTRAESFKTYLGSLTFTAPTNWGVLGGATVTGCIISGFDAAINPVAQPGGSFVLAGADQTSYYLGATFNTPVTGLRLGVAYDYLGVGNQALTHGSYANALGLYASYQLTPKASLSARGEYASSDTQTLAGTPLNLLGTRKVFEATGTFQYDLWANVVSRLECRWDHSAAGAAYGGESAAEPPTKRNSVILIADLVYRF